MSIISSITPASGAETYAAAGGAVGGGALTARVLGPTKEYREAASARRKFLTNFDKTMSGTAGRNIPRQSIPETIQTNVRTAQKVFSETMHAASPSKTRVAITAAVGLAGGFAAMAGAVNGVQSIVD